MLPDLSFFCYSFCIAHRQLKHMIGSLDKLLAVRGANGSIINFLHSQGCTVSAVPELPPHGNGELSPNKQNTWSPPRTHILGLKSYVARFAPRVTALPP
jgi:hypothetical protein